MKIEECVRGEITMSFENDEFDNLLKACMSLIISKYTLSEEEYNVCYDLIREAILNQEKQLVYKYR